MADVYSGFEELSADLRQMLENSAPAEVFFDLAWFEHLAATALEPGARVQLYVTDNGGGRPMLLPMVARGRRLTALANYYSGLFGPVGEATPQGIDHLVARIAAERPRWDVVDFGPLDSHAPFSGHLTRSLGRHGFIVATDERFANWYQPIDAPDYAAYFAARPGVLRNTVQRARRRLERSTGLDVWVVDGAAAPAELARAIDDYQRVYARSWKQAEHFTAFVPGLCRLAARRGWLRLGLAYVGGEPAAAQIWLVASGKASIFKLAYDERYVRSSIGSVLTAELFRHVIAEDRVAEVDFLSGDDSYKGDWMACRRVRVGLTGYNRRTAAGLAAAARRFGGSWLRRQR